MPTDAAKRPQSKPKPKPKPRPPRQATPRVPKTPSIPHSLVSKVCGLTDPFCLHAIGAKYPDGSSSRSLPYTKRGYHTMTSDASGNAGAFIWPFFDGIAVNNLAPGSPNWTIANPIADTQRFPHVTAYRIVSYGVKISCITTPLTASGTFYIRSPALQKTVDMAVAWPDPTLALGNIIEDIPLARLNRHTVIGPHTSAPPELFYDASTSYVSGAWTQFHENGFMPLMFVIIGAVPNTSVVHMEYMIHYELLFDTTSSMNAIATPPPKSNPLIAKAAAAVTSVGSNLIGQTANSVGKFLERKAMQALATYVVGPAAGGMLMNVD